MDNSVTRTALWQQAQQGHFVGVKGVEIHYCIVKAAPQVPYRGAIVLCSGRIESYLKYWPLVQHLQQRGFDLYLWDHRGQGLSGRLLANRHIGHVHHFRDYVADMATFMRDYVNPANPPQRYLLAHSMGGAIAALYLQQYPNQFDRALLSSPMLGVQLPAPRWLIEPLLSLWHRLRPNGYALGGHDYQDRPFADNDLSHDAEQYQQFRQLYQQTPQLQLGSPSVHWIRHALATCDTLSKVNIETPLQIALAGADSIVDNQAIRAFAQRGNHPLLEVAGARHELLMEHDDYRQPLLNCLMAWFVAPDAHDDATASADRPASVAH
ncbi:alpha/beta fold hydrolase [uncultured Ferrimonas sp.]|uniref:alpha/beta fold hydrolase n=1 Tax=uncultured Ferrimonas sp. TaxID=432640 RepID=UPI00262F645D|nr:alpha/beta fold hydrolase [uncultured Ferrimonas sp.]